MAELSDHVPIEQALKHYREILDWFEPTFPGYRSIIKSLPPDDPEARLTRGWLERWGRFRQAVEQGADIDYGSLWEEIGKLNDSLPGLSSTSITRPPFRDLIDVEAFRDHCLSLGHTAEEAKIIVDETFKPENHRPRNDRETAIKAFRLHMADKSYPQIANALCPEHGDSPLHRRSRDIYGEKRLDACSDRYRAQVRDLRNVLETYTPSRSR